MHKQRTHDYDLDYFNLLYFQKNHVALKISINWSFLQNKCHY